jgi:hypothetical protein
MKDIFILYAWSVLSLSFVAIIAVDAGDLYLDFFFLCPRQS